MQLLCICEAIAYTFRVTFLCAGNETPRQMYHPYLVFKPEQQQYIVQTKMNHELNAYRESMRVVKERHLPKRLLGIY